MKYIRVFAYMLSCALVAGAAVAADTPAMGKVETGHVKPTEVPPPKSLPCFPGAYYRKAVSSMDHWTGIEGIITLPHLTLDNARRKPTGRFLDNPSIYMGGLCGKQEIDAGLTWEVIREKDGTVSKIGKAFRPFWRDGGWHSAPAKPEYYYHPGDTVRMSCTAVGPSKLQIKVELLERAKNGDGATSKSAAARKKSRTPSSQTYAGWKPISVFSADFDAPGFGPDAIQQFKRVDAIDQSGNEGKPVQPTRARVLDAVWHDVWLIRGAERLPMIPSRFTDMRCPDPSHFIVQPAGPPGMGGERISIYGDPAMKPKP